MALVSDSGDPDLLVLVVLSPQGNSPLGDWIQSVCGHIVDESVPDATSPACRPVFSLSKILGLFSR